MIKNVRFTLIIVTLFTLSVNGSLLAGGKWYNYYEDGLKEMKKGRWSAAIHNFKIALSDKRSDKSRVRTYGMHFIEYFPHREIGICYFNLGEYSKARRELIISHRQQYSARAQEYITKLNNLAEQTPPKKTPENKVTKTEPAPPEKVTTPPEVHPVSTVAKPLKLVGERMRLAVLPFQSIGISNEMGNLNVVEQMMTTFYNLKRFNLFERSQLELILEEQKLGMSGMIDATTAAEIGKGIGVDAIVIGSVTKAGRSLSINARLIDTESAEIITAQDETIFKLDIPNIKEAINKLSTKIVNDLPLVSGVIIQVENGQLTLDVGTNKGVKKGMKCVAYREGAEIIHPITQKVLGKKTEELGILKLKQVYAQFSIAEIIGDSLVSYQVGDKVITK